MMVLSNYTESILLIMVASYKIYRRFSVRKNSSLKINSQFEKSQFSNLLTFQKRIDCKLASYFAKTGNVIHLLKLCFNYERLIIDGTFLI